MSLLQKSASVELSRRTQQFQAKKQSYDLGNQIQIEIDTQREHIDMESLRFVYELHASATGTAKSTNPQTASSVIKNLRVKTLSGNMIGREIREYRGWARFLDKQGVYSGDNRNSYQDFMEGALGADALGGDATAGSRQYAHKFVSHILSLKEYYPAHFHQGLMIEIDLPSNAYEMLKYLNGAPTITIKEARIVCDLVQVKPDLENEQVRLMEEQKLFVDYIEVLNQEQNIFATSSQSYDVVGIDGRVKSAFVFWVTARGRDGTDDYWGDDDANASSMGRNKLNSYRFRLGSRYLNYSNIKVGASDTGNDYQAEGSMEMSKALDIHQKSGMLMLGDKSTFTTTDGIVKTTHYVLRNTSYFAVGVKVDKAQSDVDEVISSQVDKDRNNLRVELNFNSAPTVSDGFTYIVLDKRLQLLPGSIVRNVRS